MQRMRRHFHRRLPRTRPLPSPGQADTQCSRARELVTRPYAADGQVLRNNPQPSTYASPAAALFGYDTEALIGLPLHEPIIRESIDLNALVASLEPLPHLLIGSSILLAFDFAASVRRIAADPSQLAQMLVHLVANARDALPFDGTVTITISDCNLDQPRQHRQGEIPAGAYVCLSVRDTGIGMNEEVLSHLFEPFFSTKPRTVAMGLGLTTCARIVRAHFGHIGVDSVPGKGTTISVYLPCLTTPRMRWVGQYGDSCAGQAGSGS